jgi:hypothetical protein
MTREAGIGKGMDRLPVPVWARSLLRFPKRPDRLWGPPSPPVIGYRDPFPMVKRPELDAHSPPSSAFMGRAERSGDTVRTIKQGSEDGKRYTEFEM